MNSINVIIFVSVLMIAANVRSLSVHRIKKSEDKVKSKNIYFDFSV